MLRSVYKSVDCCATDILSNDRRSFTFRPK